MLIDISVPIPIVRLEPILLWKLPIMLMLLSSTQNYVGYAQELTVLVEYIRIS